MNDFDAAAARVELDALAVFTVDDFDHGHAGPSEFGRALGLARRALAEIDRLNSEIEMREPIAMEVMGVTDLTRDAAGVATGLRCTVRLTDGSWLQVGGEGWPEDYWPPEPGDVLALRPAEIVSIARPRKRESS